MAQQTYASTQTTRDRGTVGVGWRTRKGSKGDCDYVRLLVANRSWRGLYAVPGVMLEATGRDGPGTGGLLSGDLLAKVFGWDYCQWGGVWAPGEVVWGIPRGLGHVPW